MPELPEVETIARALKYGGRDAPSIVGRTIDRVDLLWERTLETPSPTEFHKRVPGQIITDVYRRAKYLVLKLSRDTMLIHLRMSGDILVASGIDIIGSHPRLVLYFLDDWHMTFTDTRKFGRVWLLTNPERVFAKLGPEPFDSSLTSTKFHQLLQRRKRQIKPLLMDQTFLAGMGNIYTDEALFKSQIHPRTKANTLSKVQATDLLKNIRSVLNTGIQHNGASIDWVYRGGDFQNKLLVYQRTGEPCPVCYTTIERIIVGQRSTHICPSCQEFPDEPHNT
jgi:formamidopyrimidine-DNA glycosylase